MTISTVQGFERDRRIFRDKDVLSRDHHPETIQGRDKEIEAYVKRVRAALREAPSIDVPVGPA